MMTGFRLTWRIENQTVNTIAFSSIVKIITKNHGFDVKKLEKTSDYVFDALLSMPDRISWKIKKGALQIDIEVRKGNMGGAAHGFRGGYQLCLDNKTWEEVHCNPKYEDLLLIKTIQLAMQLRFQNMTRE